MYFSATIFALVGFNAPILASLSIAVTNFLLTSVAFFLIDRVGRRRILLLSIPVMIAGLVLCALAFNFIHLPTPHDAIEGSAETSNGATFWAFIILLSMVVYVCGYGVGMGPCPGSNPSCSLSPCVLLAPASRRRRTGGVISSWV